MFQHVRKIPTLRYFCLDLIYWSNDSLGKKLYSPSRFHVTYLPKEPNENSFDLLDSFYVPSFPKQISHVLSLLILTIETVSSTFQMEKLKPRGIKWVFQWQGTEKHVSNIGGPTPKHILWSLLLYHLLIYHISSASELKTHQY